MTDEQQGTMSEPRQWSLRLNPDGVGITEPAFGLAGHQGEFVRVVELTPAIASFL